MQHHKAAKLVLGSREAYQPFLCSNHQNCGKEIIHTVISNIYFSNTRKKVSDSIVADNIVAFEKREKNENILFHFFNQLSQRKNSYPVPDLLTQNLKRNN